jgi:hypothetical protein
MCLNATSYICKSTSYYSTWEKSRRTPESSSKLKGTSSLLVSVRKFVGENIKKRMSLILEAWDTGSNIVSFGSKLNSFREYVQVDLNNEEGFYKDVVHHIYLESFWYD